MAVLYSIKFTTRSLVYTLDERGGVVGTSQIDKPVAITALPHPTAMSYSGCDNFQIEIYQPDTRNARPSVRRTKPSYSASTQATAPAPRRSTIQNAAATGDFAAAINA